MFSNTKVSFWGEGGTSRFFSWRTRKMIKIIVSQTNSYIVSCNFLLYVQQFKSFIFGGFLFPEDPLGVLFPDDPTCGQNNFLTNNFLHCKFQHSMFSSLEVVFRWEGFSFRKARKVGQNNCLTNNFLHCDFQVSIFFGEAILDFLLLVDH